MSTDLTDDELIAMWNAESVPERSTSHLVRAFARAAIAADRERRASSAAAVPAGCVPVPKRPTAEMLRVMDSEGWAWEDLLAAAEAITQDEYEEIAATPAPPQAVPATDAQALTLGNAPLGTRAPALGGGHWIKVDRGWKWHAGSTFPRPGGDWTGELIKPAAPVAVNAAPELPARESVDDALMIVESYGPWGTDLNDAHRRQIVLADEVKRLRRLYEMAVEGRSKFRAAFRAPGAGSREPLTEDEVFASDRIMEVNAHCGLSMRWLMELVYAIEHTIAARGKA